LKGWLLGFCFEIDLSPKLGTYDGYHTTDNDVNRWSLEITSTYLRRNKQLIHFTTSDISWTKHVMWRKTLYRHSPRVLNVSSPHSTRLVNLTEVLQDIPQRNKPMTAVRKSDSFTAEWDDYNNHNSRISGFLAWRYTMMWVERSFVFKLWRIGRSKFEFICHWWNWTAPTNTQLFVTLTLQSS